MLSITENERLNTKRAYLDTAVPLTPTEYPSENDVLQTYNTLSLPQKNALLLQLLKNSPVATLQAASCVILPLLKQDFMVLFLFKLARNPFHVN